MWCCHYLLPDSLHAPGEFMWLLCTYCVWQGDILFIWVNFLNIQYIPRNMHTVFALLCFVVVIHWLIFPYPSGLLHWHCGNLTIAPVPAKQPWWIWIYTSCEFIMNDCITTTKQSTTKPCAYFLGYTVVSMYEQAGAQTFPLKKYWGFDIDPYCFHVCEGHGCPKILTETCMHGYLAGFGAMVASKIYPGFILLVLKTPYGII